jgi:predicted ATPase
VTDPKAAQSADHPLLTTLTLLAVSPSPASLTLPEGATMLAPASDEAAVLGFALPKAALAYAMEVRRQCGHVRAGLLIGTPTHDFIERARSIANVSEPGQMLVTLAVQDLLRDAEGGCQFHAVGAVMVSGRIERLFLATRLADMPQAQTATETALTLRFIGRRRELNALQKQVDAGRLATVYGIPGIGKSALLRRFLAEQEGRFPDGAWLVDLEQVRHPDVLLTHVGRALDISRLPGETYEDAILSALAEKQALLIFDNGHRVLPALKALVARLLHAGTQLAIVLGSRRILRLSGEIRFRLDGLENASYAEDWRAVRDYDAVALFEERAIAADPEFSITEKNAADVAHLCHRLDGNPLAIELAALKTSVLSPRQILGRLEHRFLVLKQNSGPSKLEQTLQWAYQMLSPDAKNLARNLLVFRGAFTFDWAEEVCGQGREAHHFHATFEELLDTAFVLSEANSGQAKFFRISETIRAFLAQEAKPEKAAEKAHREWCLELAKAAAEGLAGREQARWLDTLDAAFEDMRHIVSEASLPKGDVRLAIDILLACSQYFMLRNYYQEGLKLADRLSRSRGANEIAETARLLNLATGLSYYLADYRNGRLYGLRSLRLSRKLGNEEYAGRARCNLGMLAQRRGDDARARRHYLAALQLMQPGTDQYLTVIGNVLLLECTMGLLESAEARYLRAAPMIEECGDPGIQASLQLNCSHLALLQGNYGLSEQLGVRCLRTSIDLGDLFSVALATRTLLTVRARTGRGESAALMIGASKNLLAKCESQPLDLFTTQFETTCEQVRNEMGVERYQEMLMDGASLSLEQLYNLAVESASVTEAG